MAGAYGSQPVSFMLETYQPALDESRRRLAHFLNTEPSGLVFVPNATFGVNSVLRSMEDQLAPGDEIVVTDHGYNACTNAVSVSAAKRGARMVVATVPFPIDDLDTIVTSVLDRVTERMALVVIDHVTSPTGMIIPIEKVVRELEPQVPVLVDGAHAPGMLDVDLAGLGASFYTANCHKWLCAPKGSGFLDVAEHHREWMSAAVISHGHNSGWPGSSGRFHSQFDWTGTNDPTALLSVRAALEVMDDHHPDGWSGIRQTNHDLCMTGRSIVADALGIGPPLPETMVGCIAAMPLPPSRDGAANIFDLLMITLRRKWAIEVPVFAWPDSSQRLIRISAQQYNREDDYERLARALRAEL